MKLTILGSCSGTEAMPGRRHTSTCLEVGDEKFLLDAGDSCGYTMHLNGIDVRKISAVFISHPHIDHIGGLPYLMFLIKKLHWRMGTELENPLHIYASTDKFIEGMKLFMNYSEEDSLKSIDYHPVTDGVIYDTPTMKVTARHNAHMGETEPPFHSYSYLIEAEGKKLLYSGDVKDLSELEGWLDCDLLMMETGHHDPDSIYERLMSMEKRPKRLLYVHHGRKTLADPEGLRQRAKATYDGWTEVAEDMMVIEL